MTPVEQASNMLKVACSQLDAKLWRDIKAQTEVTGRAVLLAKSDALSGVQSELRKLMNGNSSDD